MSRSTFTHEFEPTFDFRHVRGPFDIIGDIHGCVDELWELLGALGYSREPDDAINHPLARRVVLLGDLGDRGPHSAEAFRLAMLWVEKGQALYTPGNHCDKLKRYLQGRKPRLSQGLEGTVAQVEEMERREPGFKERLRLFIETAPLYLWLDKGRLVVAHAGIKKKMVGRSNGKVRTMVLYGDITGETNPDGTPVRLDWAKDYKGAFTVVYGHTPVAVPRWRNNTANIDQGCVFGGWLTAARWPERAFVQVGARHAYYTERTPTFLVRRVRHLTQHS
jgi:protein phosphatase